MGGIVARQTLRVKAIVAKCHDFAGAEFPAIVHFAKAVEEGALTPPLQITVDKVRERA